MYFLKRPSPCYHLSTIENFNLKNVKVIDVIAPYKVKTISGKQKAPWRKAASGQFHANVNRHINNKTYLKCIIKVYILKYKIHLITIFMQIHVFLTTMRRRNTVNIYFSVNKIV